MIVFGAIPAQAGAGFYGVDYLQTTLPQQDLNRMHDGRVDSVRLSLYWQNVEPVQGTFDWSGYDALIGNLASKHIHALPTLYGSPSYAAPTANTPPLGSKAARQQWKEFLREAVKRYGPGGDYWTNPVLYSSQHPGARALPIRTWQVWNEPNLHQHFAPRPSVRRYARLLRISHAAIHSQDDHARVLLAGMPGYGERLAWNFLDHLYRLHGIKRAFDGVALHPYALNLSQLRHEIEKVRHVMRSRRDRRTPLWITELGWGSKRTGGVLNRGPQGQKRMLSRSFRLIHRERHRWRIRRLFWFEWRDPPPNQPAQCTFCSSAGLFRYNGIPKPAWRAFQRLSG